MGKFSRDKGRRGEYTLRDFLKARGYEAIRVPLSGASEGYKGDVVARRGEETLKFELKCRKDAFKKIYAFFDAVGKKPVTLFADERLYCIHTEPNQENVYEHFDRVLERLRPDQRKNAVRALAQIKSLEKLLGGCDYLVVKNDHKPFLFIRYA